MARWRLINAHYLNTVTPTEWEYKETDRGSGKQGRKIFHVPLYMDPRDPADHNYPGEIIVSNQFDKAFPKDIEILGDPTPDMEPLDEEAEAISESLQHKWVHPIDTLPVVGDEKTWDDLTLRMMEAFSKATGQVANLSAAPGPTAKEFNDMKLLLEDLKAQLASQAPASPIPAEATGRRA
jgi:hypothetical protein